MFVTLIKQKGLDPIESSMSTLANVKLSVAVPEPRNEFACTLRNPDEIEVTIRIDVSRNQRTTVGDIRIKGERVPRGIPQGDVYGLELAV